MSTQTTSRAQRGGNATRGARAGQFQATRGRANSRGSSAARARGRARGGSNHNGPSNGDAGGADGLLQKLREGTTQRSAAEGTPTGGRGRGAATHRGSSAPIARDRGTGRGRGNLSQVFNNDKQGQSTPTPSRTSSPAPTNYRDLMNAAESNFKTLQKRREEERAQAIRDGFLSDPEKKTSLANAITPVGTCTDMCPRFERVERIHQQMVDQAEKVHDEDSGRYLPSEDRMVKRFRRSAAGYDEQLPSDIRTPETLKRTLDYLLDKLIGGGQRLATVHKFVWDRTRGIRNDFSIQQVTKPEHVKLAVECYERIARFHILSLHQLANPDNLYEDENFDAHQDREQLNNTLLSLLYYYDDHRDRIHFPNEAEFRAYCIIFELQSQNPDIQDRVQQWPDELLRDQRVKVALKLYNAAGNTLFAQGPLQPRDVFAIAQNNNGSFWSVLASNGVPYILACVAELYFGPIRFAALDALWRSVKSAPQAQQARSRDWSLSEMTTYLGIDTEDETREFCAAFGLAFVTDDHGEEFLDPTSLNDNSLDQSSIPQQQAFSHEYVEKKRYRRSLTAVINGVSVARAIREGLVESDDSKDDTGDSYDDENSLFIPENKPSSSRSGLDPAAPTFSPASSSPSTFGKPTNFKALGIPVPSESSAPQYQTTSFGQPTRAQSPLPSFGMPSQPTSTQGTSNGFFGIPTATTKSLAPFGQPKEPQKSIGATDLGSLASGQTPSSSFSSGRPQSASAPAAHQQLPLPQPQQQQQAHTSVPAFSGLNPDKVPASNGIAPGTAAATFDWASAGKSTVSPQASQSVPAFSATPPAPFPKTDFSTHTHSTFSPTSLPSASSSSANQASATPFKFPQFDLPKLSSAQPPPVSQQLNLPQEASSSSQGGLDPKEGTLTFKPTFTQPSTTADLRPSLQVTSVGGSHSAPFPPISTSGQVEKKPFQTDLNPTLPALNFPSGLTSPSDRSQASQPKSLQRKRSLETFTTPKVPSPLSRSTTPPHSPPRQSTEPSLVQKRNHKLVDDLARVALVRPGGLIQQFVEWTLPELLESVIEQHRREVYRARVDKIRHRIIMRKFANIWRALTWNNGLKRKANNRRQKFAEAVKAQDEKKNREIAEIEAIKAAVEETKRIQKLQRDKQEDDRVVKEMLQARRAQQLASAGVIKVAGQKRKSLSGQDESKENHANELVSTSTPGHKRSRTIGTISEPSSSATRLHHSIHHKAQRQPSHTSSPSKANTLQTSLSILSRSTSSEQLRQSRAGLQQLNNTGRKVDTTKTDYFRLKALGIDPQTPLIPLTAVEVESKKKREAEDRQAALDRLIRRRHTGREFSRTSSPPPSHPASVMKTIEVEPTSAHPSPSAVNGSTNRTSDTASITDLDHEIEALIQQSRKQREELAKDTDWLKESRYVLEQQFDDAAHFAINQHLAKPAQSMGSADTITPSPNGKGLARINGFDYLPANSRSGSSLSRTEQRIRTTGAHGLANKPLRTHRDYVTVGVAMSKRSASSIYRPDLSSQRLPSPDRKRLLETIDPALYDGEEGMRNTKRTRLTPDKTATHSHEPAAKTPSSKQNTFDILGSLNDNQYEEEDDQTDELSVDNSSEQDVPDDLAEDDYDKEEDDDDSEEEDEVEDGAEAPSRRKPSYGQQDFALQYDDDDDLEEEEEEEEEDYEEDYDLDENQASPKNDYGRLPAEEYARESRSASSAPGATEDDALVLSDSD